MENTGTNPPAAPAQGVPAQPQAPALSQEDRIGAAFAANEQQHAQKPQAAEPAQPQAAAAEEGVDAAAAPVAGEGDPKTLAELAKLVGVDVEDLLNLTMDYDIAGEKGSKTLKEIHAGFQLNGYNTQKSQQLSQKMLKVEQDFKAQQDAGNKYFAELRGIVGAAEEMLQNNFQRIDWDLLRQQDPSRYGIEREAFRERQAWLQTVKQQAQQKSNEFAAQAQQRQQAKAVETYQFMADLRPEWRDTTAFNKDCETIKAAVLKAGLPAEDLPMILQHPAYLTIADGFAKFMALQAAQPAVEKRVQAAPKFMRPGNRGAPPNGNVKAQGALKALQADPKNVDKQAAAFEALLG